MAEEIEGSEESPAAKVKCYKPDDGGKWKPTDVHKGMACKDLSVVMHPMDDDEEVGHGDEPAAEADDKPAPPAKPKALSLAALPPLPIGRTRAEAEAEMEATAKRLVMASLEAYYGAV